MVGTSLGHSYGKDGLCVRCNTAQKIVLYMEGSCEREGWENAYIQVYADGEPFTKAFLTAEGGTQQITLPHIPCRTYTLEWNRGINDGAYDASCRFELTVDGKMVLCANGGDYADKAVIYTMGSPANHRYQEVNTPATCTQDGSVVQTCVTCGDSRIISTTPATGHSLLTTETIASCTESGHQLHQCVNCDYHVIDNITPPTGHRYENGACTVCGLYLIGNVTGDGKVNITDVAVLYSHVKGVSTIIDPRALQAADYNGDSKINITDVAQLYAAVKG